MSEAIAPLTPDTILDHLLGMARINGGARGRWHEADLINQDQLYDLGEKFRALIDPLVAQTDREDDWKRTAFHLPEIPRHRRTWRNWGCECCGECLFCGDNDKGHVWHGVAEYSPYRYTDPADGLDGYCKVCFASCDVGDLTGEAAIKRAYEILEAHHGPEIFYDEEGNPE